MARRRRRDAQGSTAHQPSGALAVGRVPTTGGKNGLLGLQGGPAAGPLIEAMAAAIYPARPRLVAPATSSDTPPDDDPPGSPTMH